MVLPIFPCSNKEKWPKIFSTAIKKLENFKQKAALLKCRVRKTAICRALTLTDNYHCLKGSLYSTQNIPERKDGSVRL